ncbi:TPA: hypothetical protein OUD88_002888 [Enterobacter hormaechei]|nr:hypothetical protein [Enterobacter hormaechei]
MDLLKYDGKDKRLFKTGYYFSVIGSSEDKVTLSYPEGMELLTEYDSDSVSWLYVLLCSNRHNSTYEGLPVEAFKDGVSLGVQIIQ